MGGPNNGVVNLSHNHVSRPIVKKRERNPEEFSKVADSAPTSLSNGSSTKSPPTVSSHHPTSSALSSSLRPVRKSKSPVNTKSSTTPKPRSSRPPNSATGSSTSASNTLSLSTAAATPSASIQQTTASSTNTSSPSIAAAADSNHQHRPTATAAAGVASTQQQPPPTGGGTAAANGGPQQQPAGASSAAATSSRSQRNSRRKRAVGVESPQVTPAGTDVQVPAFNGSKNKDSSNPSRKSLMLPLRGGGPNKQNDNVRRYTREQLMSYRSLRASNVKPKIPSSVDINSPENRDARRHFPPSGQRDDRNGGRGGGGRFGPRDEGGRGDDRAGRGDDRGGGRGDWRQEPRFGRPGDRGEGGTPRNNGAEGPGGGRGAAARGPNPVVDRQSWRGGAIRKENDRFDRSEDRYDARRNGRNPQPFSPRFGATAPPDLPAPRFTTAQGPVEGSRGFGKRTVGPRAGADDKKDGGGAKDGDSPSTKDDITSPRSEADRPSEVSYMRALPRQGSKQQNDVVVPAGDDGYRDEAYADAVTKKTGTGRPDADAADADETPEWDDDEAIAEDAEPFQLGVTPLQRDADKAFLHQHGYLPDTPVVPQPAGSVQNPDAPVSEQQPQPPQGGQQGPGGMSIVVDAARAQQQGGQGAAPSSTALGMLRNQQQDQQQAQAAGGAGGPAPLDLSKGGLTGDQQDRPPEASPRDIAMVDRLLDDADGSNASTMDRMFAAIGGGDSRGAPGSDAQGAAGSDASNRAAYRAAHGAAPGAAVSGDEGAALLSGAAPSLQQNPAAGPMDPAASAERAALEREATRRRRAARLERYVRHGWPTEPPPDVPDRSAEYSIAMQRGDEQAAMHIKALAKKERHALRHYKARQQAAMAYARAEVAAEADRLVQAHALGDEATLDADTYPAVYRSKRYDDPAVLEYERAVREQYKMKMKLVAAREAARRGEPYDERYLRGASGHPSSDRRAAEAEAAAAYYASRGRHARTREEAIAHERARLELLARGGGHRGGHGSAYPRTYAEFQEEFDGEIPPLRNVPPEFSMPQSANQAYRDPRDPRATPRGGDHYDPRRQHFEDHLRQAYRDEHRHQHQQQRRLREQAYYAEAAAAARGDHHSAASAAAAAQEYRSAREREHARAAAYAAHQRERSARHAAAAAAAPRAGGGGAGHGTHLAPPAPGSNTVLTPDGVVAAPFRAETPEVTDFFASNPSPDEVIQFIETAKTPALPPQSGGAPGSGPGSTTGSMTSGSVPPQDGGHGGQGPATEGESASGDAAANQAPSQPNQPQQGGGAHQQQSAPPSEAAPSESGTAPSTTGGDRLQVPGGGDEAPGSSAASTVSSHQGPHQHDQAAYHARDERMQQQMAMQQQQQADGSDADSYDQALPELPSLRGLSLGAGSSSRRAAAAAHAQQQQHAAAAAALGDVMAGDPRADPRGYPDARHLHPSAAAHYSSRDRAELAARYAAARGAGYSGSSGSSRAAAIHAYQQQQAVHHARRRSRGREEEYARMLALREQHAAAASRHAAYEQYTSPRARAVPRTREEQEYYEYERLRRRQARHAAAQQAAAAAGHHRSSSHHRTPSHQHQMMQQQAYAQEQALREQYGDPHADPRARAHHEARLAAREQERARAAEYATRRTGQPPHGGGSGTWPHYLDGGAAAAAAAGHGGHHGHGGGAAPGQVPLDDPRYPASDAAASATSSAALASTAPAAGTDHHHQQPQHHQQAPQQGQVPRAGEEQRKPAFPPQEAANAVQAS